MEYPVFHWADFLEVSNLSIFSKIFDEIQVSFKNLTIITGTLYEDRYTYMIISR